MTARVDELIAWFMTLSDDEQSIVRDLVELTSRRLWTERLEASVPFKISAGATCS